MGEVLVPEVGIWQLLFERQGRPFPENHGIVSPLT
jgi:hypothetical protein